jgi:plastocyanin
MSIRFHLFVMVTGAAALFVACEQHSPQPLRPSIVETAPPAITPSAGAPAVTQPPAQLAAKAGANQHVVTMFDACDPETFDAALGAGTCSRSGGVRFDKFLELLGLHHSIGGWHFAPPNVTMRVGEDLVATNKGGETHTFTEVDEFGGGIVPVLNQLTGLTTVAPECQRLSAGDFLTPGASSRETEHEAGVEKYQCCIHPWMRAEVRIAEK